jgi:hypothetical protein
MARSYTRPSHDPALWRWVPNGGKAHTLIRFLACFLALGPCPKDVPHGPAPVVLSDCTLKLRSDGAGFRAISSFTFRNAGPAPAAAARIEYRGWTHSREALRERPTGGIFDYLHTLPPGATVTVSVSTTRSLRPRPAGVASHPPCRVLAVRFTDGSFWNLRPGIAVP